MMPRSVLFILFILFIPLSLTVPHTIFANVYKKCTKPGLVAMTFDDGVTKNYPVLLDILDQVDVKATFFIEGQVSVDKNRYHFLFDVYRRGHEIGNHTWAHPRLITLTEKELDSEITRTDALIHSVVGYAKVLKYMRPPYGELDTSVVNYLTLHENKIVLWNIEVIGDWRKGKTKRSRDQLWNSFLNGFKDANPDKDSYILLQHDKSIDSVTLVPNIVQVIRNKGFRIVPLDVCLKS